MYAYTRVEDHNSRSFEEKSIAGEVNLSYLVFLLKTLCIFSFIHSDIWESGENL